MSTKTSIKRVALVAAAALTIGGFSAVSANAAATATAVFSVDSTTVVSSTAGIAATATAVGDGNHYVSVRLAMSKTDGAYTISTSGAGALYGAATVTGDDATNTSIQYVTASGNVAGGFTVETGTVPQFPTAGLFKASDTVTFTAVSSAAGTQVITATPVNGTSAASTITITWGAAPTISVGNSTAVLVETTTTNIISSSVFTAAGTTDATTPILSTYNATAPALILVTLNDNEAPKVPVKNTTLTATVSGVGLVGGTGASTPLTGLDRTAITTYSQSAQSYTDNNGQAFFGLTGSGASGTSTITIKQVNTTTGVSTVIATKTIAFYSTTVASLKVIANSNIALSKTGSFVPEFDNGDNSKEMVLYATGADSNGNAIPAAVVSKVTSSNPLVATVAAGLYNANAGGTNVSGTDLIVNPLSVGTTTVTVYDSTGLITATGTLTVASSAIASVKSVTDASAYDPATKVKWNTTALDASGLPVADGYYVGFWTTAPVTTVGLQGWTGNGDTTTLSTVNGVQEIDVYAPVTPGTSASITGGVISKDGAIATALQGTTVADVTFAVNGGSDASGAVDAANSATDAANAAADAADNATQAASEALAAVNSLATTVASLIAGIKAQITSLTNLITKIKNKVGA